MKKKGARQRIILDTRRCNQHFVKPPTTRLPTPGAVSHLQTSSEKLGCAQGDVENAFYGMAVPDAVGRYFALPRVNRSFLLKAGVSANDLPSDVWIAPCLQCSLWGGLFRWHYVKKC